MKNLLYRLRNDAKSLSTTLAIAFTTISIAALLIAGAFHMTIHFQAQDKIVAANQLLIARDAAGKVAGFIRRKFNTMNTAVAFENPFEGTRGQSESVLATMLRMDDAFRNLVLLDTDGRKTAVMSRQSQSLSVDYARRLDASFLTRVLEARQYISNLYIDPVTYEPLVTMTVHILDLFGDFKGILVAEVNLKFMWDLVGRMEIGKTGLVYVVNRHGDLLAVKDTARVLRGENMRHVQVVDRFMETRQESKSTGPLLYKGIDGKRVIGTYIPLGTPDWAVVTELPVSEAYAQVVRSILISISILIAVSLVAAMAGVYVAKRLSVPLVNLTDTATRITRGETKLFASVKGPREITVLAGAFNKMTRQLVKMLNIEENRAVDLQREIDHRRKTEEQLNSLRSYLSNILDSMPSVLIGVDVDGRVTHWNKAAEQVTGIMAESAREKRLIEVFPSMSAEMEKIHISIHTRQIQQEQKRSNHSGQARYEHVTIYPLTADGVEGAVIRIDDVTAKVRMEEMMIQSEKMLSVGGLAAGMAHEINNPLAGMLQTANVMAGRLGGEMDISANHRAAHAAGTTVEAVHRFMHDRGIPRMIETICSSGRRVARIVDNMLSFARKGDMQFSSHYLSDLLDKTLTLAATDYDLKKHYDFKRIEIKKVYADDVPPVPCEGAKIQQVLLNILRNGAQAMQQGDCDHPIFVIRTYWNSKPGYASIEIEDNGPGMNEDIRKRIFEPFFTTKPVGVGTGLGLSVSYFIVTKNHAGEMLVESRPGAGAKFIIHLPLKNHTDNSM